MEIVNKGEIKLAGIKVVGRRSELSHRVPLAWLELKANLGAVENHVNPDLFYGVFPQSHHQNDGVGGVHTYWVGVEVSAFGAVPASLTTLTIPAQTYLMTTAKGQADAIEAAYTGLYGHVRDLGRKTDPNGFGFELYDQRRQPPTPPYEQFDFDIFLPLA